MLDALPYLIDYTYGCTEQTMSRFLPTAITAKTLKELGLEPEAVMDKVFGGIAREHVSKTQPKGKRDLGKLEEMIRQGLNRLYDFQHSDGGWGWWKEGESDHFMTAYVVWGLSLARDAGITVKTDVLVRGVNNLDKEIVEEEDNYDQQAWMLHALAAYHSTPSPGGVGKFQAKAFENLWTHREKLNAYTRSLLALSAHDFGLNDRAKVLIQNLENGVKTDKTSDSSVIDRGAERSQEAVMGTAHWGEDGIYWRWSEGGVEATSFALRALLAIDPKSRLIEPVTNWLLKDRRGAQWSNTRDTAIAVLALNNYLRESGELKPEIEYELLVNGHSIVTRKIAPANALSEPSQFTIDRKIIKDGPNEVHIVRRSGNSPIYFAVQAQFFSLEKPVSAAGNEIFVRRQYYRMASRPTLLKGFVYNRQPLNDGETLKSGERVETVIIIEAKNNYEYLVFEDLKPAGLEAVQIRSGESLYANELKSSAVKNSKSLPQGLAPQIEGSDYTGRTHWFYQELRDRKVALFF
jgi:alpha-2-macroglobulin